MPFRVTLASGYLRGVGFNYYYYYLGLGAWVTDVV